AAGAPRRVDDAARAVGLRQDHAAQSRRRLFDAGQRRDRYRRPANDGCAGVSARDRHHVPELRVVPAHERGGQRRVLTTVTLALLVAGLVSGWMFAAILSFNEFTASLFVTVQRTQCGPIFSSGAAAARIRASTANVSTRPATDRLAANGKLKLAN